MKVAVKPIRNPDAIDISRYPLIPMDIYEILGICVYNCGQGDSIAVYGLDKDSRKAKSGEGLQKPLHIDYGGYQDNPHRQHNYVNCLSHWPIHPDGTILLTHWDQDHYWSGLRDTNLHTKKWLVPRQKVSSRVAVFSTKLQNGGCWPENRIHNAIRFRTGSGDEIWIEKIAKMSKPGRTENRNESGLAVSILRKRVNNIPDLIICPGDAPYSKIPHLQYLRPACRLIGFVAYHHGSEAHWRQSDSDILTAGPAVSMPTVVYSASPNNQWKHPHQYNYQRTFPPTSRLNGLREKMTFSPTQNGTSIKQDILFPDARHRFVKYRQLGTPP